MVIYPVPVEVTQARIQLLVDQNGQGAPEYDPSGSSGRLPRQGGRRGSGA